MIIQGVAQSVERCVWGAEVGSSKLSTLTVYPLHGSVVRHKYLSPANG